MRTVNTMAVSGFALFGSLFAFFVPLIYDATLFKCSNPGMACFTPSGMESLGYLLFHWGGTYSFALGYATPPVDSMLTFGVLIVYALSLALICVGWFAPQVIEMSKKTRIGFTAFGAFVFALSVFFVVSLSAPFFVIALILAPTGIAMFVYGVHSLREAHLITSNEVDLTAITEKS